MDEKCITRDDFKDAFDALREEGADKPEMSIKEIDEEISASRIKRQDEKFNAGLLL